MEVAKWLWEINGSKGQTRIDLHRENELIFRVVCEGWRLDIVIWLWELSGSEDQTRIDIHTNNEEAFRSAGWEIAEWLWNLSGSKGQTRIDLHANEEEVFRYACKNDFWHRAKWLWDVSGSEGQRRIDIHAANEWAFCRACKYDNLKIAKWLWHLSGLPGQTRINIRANNYAAFRSACKKNHGEMVDWLCKLDDSLGYRIGKHYRIKPMIRDPIQYLINKEKYMVAMDLLRMQTQDPIESDEPCMWCHEQCPYRFKLNCQHTICLKAYDYFERHGHTCLYHCEETFEWSDCRLVFHDDQTETSA